MSEPEKTEEETRHFILNAETGYLGWSVPAEPKSEPEEEPSEHVC